VIAVLDFIGTIAEPINFPLHLGGELSIRPDRMASYHLAGHFFFIASNDTGAIVGVRKDSDISVLAIGDNVSTSIQWSHRGVGQTIAVEQSLKRFKGEGWYKREMGRLGHAYPAVRSSIDRDELSISRLVNKKSMAVACLQ